MIAEVLLVLAGHSSSLFQDDNTLHPSFVPLLHPGEEQCISSLGEMAFRYRSIKASMQKLLNSRSRYICALCSQLKSILRDEYESLIIETEAKVLQKDSSLVANGSFIPLSSIRALFSEWDSPLRALADLMTHLQESTEWPPGPLIDLLLNRSQTGIYRVSSIMSRLAVAVQRSWRAQLQTFVVHGALSQTDSIALPDYTLRDDAIPSCVSAQARESIMYVGRAIATVRTSKWHKHMPTSLALEHARLLDAVLPQDRHAFDTTIEHIRTNVSEWLWSTILTLDDVEDAVHTLAEYFLLRNGEFCLSLIHEIERMKHSKLTSRSGPSTLIREQDLNHALLRASLGTSAQNDAALPKLRLQLPSGPLRPFIPSTVRGSLSASVNGVEGTAFDDLLLGTPLRLTYSISWPLDLFLHASDMTTYSMLFSYLSSLRHVHTRVHTCWTSLSNAQRMRRKWTGLGEGGTEEDLQARKELLRCAWGTVRTMSWLLDVLLNYLMIDVVEAEFRRLKSLLRPASAAGMRSTPSGEAMSSLPQSTSRSSVQSQGSPLDFTTLHNFHALYLERLLSASLLSQPGVTGTIRSILEVCERLTAQVERWGGDVLPALLFEGSVGSAGADGVGKMVKERWRTVREIDEAMQGLVETFYEQLSTASMESGGGGDGSRSVMMNATGGTSVLQPSRVRLRGAGGDGDTRRHIERLLLRLDFNGALSRGGGDVLRAGGLA